MFLTRHIWKRGVIGALLVALVTLTLGSLATAGPVQAAGETYTWTDTTYTKVTATGGSFATPATFTKDAAATAGASFTAAASVICAGTAKPATLTLALDATSYNQGKPAAGVTGALTIPPDAACAGLDTLPSINAPPAAAASSTVANNNSCDQGSLSWLFCPLIDKITEGISTIAKTTLTPLLRVNSISPSSTPALYSVWQHMRDLADVFFLLIFIIIIIGTLTQQDFMMLDQYTIKKTWPYLVAASILVQFSFLICGLMVDIGNVAGAGVENLIKAAIPTGMGQTGGNPFENIILGVIGALGVGGAGVVVLGAGALAAWEIALPLLTAVFISLLVVFLTLGLRYILIAILIAIAPLAFMAMVLPNTRKLYHDWFDLLLKLILMYPIIIAAISFAGLVNQILPFSSGTTDSGIAAFAVGLMKPIIAIGTLLLIPLSFRVASSALHRARVLMGGKVQSGLRNSDMWQRGVEARQNNQSKLMSNVMNSKPITKLSGGKGAVGAFGRVGAGMLTGAAGVALLNAPKSRPALQSLQSRLVRSARKTIDDLDEASPGNLGKLRTAFFDPDEEKRTEAATDLKRDAPNLWRIGQTSAARTAAIAKLSEFEILGPTTVQDTAYARGSRSWLSTNHNLQSEYGAQISAVGAQTPKRPGIVTRFTRADDDYQLKDQVGNPVAYRGLGGQIIGSTVEEQSKIKRNIGDVDIVRVGNGLQKVTAAMFGDKHAVDNFDVMTKTDTPEYAKNANDLAIAYAMNLDPKTVTRALDPDSQKFAMRSARLKWAKAMNEQHAVFEHYDSKLVEATTTHIARDEVLAGDIVQLAVPDTDRALLSADAKAFVARDWIQGKAYTRPANFGAFNETAAKWAKGEREKPRRPERNDGNDDDETT